MDSILGSSERHSKVGSRLRDFILGWQDGLVNVLGLVLGIASATQSTKLIIISGIVAAFAEGISMSAVAYTSTKAEVLFYKSELKKEEREVRDVPEKETDEIRKIFREKGFKGKLLEDIVKTVTANKKTWVQTMMKDELGLSPVRDNPVNAAIIVLVASIVSAFIPIIPFTFLPVSTAIIYTLLLSVLTLFVAGAMEARLTIGDRKRRGIEMAAIGIMAALLGFFIGNLLGANIR